MILTAIWILEATAGLFGALLVLGDAAVILQALGERDPSTARGFRLQVARDALVLGGQFINVAIGLISGILVGRAHDGASSVLGAITLGALMVAPALLAGISFTTYRARHR